MRRGSEFDSVTAFQGEGRRKSNEVYRKTMHKVFPGTAEFPQITKVEKVNMMIIKMSLLCMSSAEAKNIVYSMKNPRLELIKEPTEIEEGCWEIEGKVIIPYKKFKKLKDNKNYLTPEP